MEERRELARAQRSHQAFSLLIFGDSLTNAAIWHQDHGGWKDVSSLVLIQELKCVFLEGGLGGRVQRHLLFCVDKPLNLGRAPYLTTSAEFTVTF